MGFVDHPAHGQVGRSGAFAGFVAADEQEVVDAVGGGGEQVPAETEEVAVSAVHAGHRWGAECCDFLGDGDAGDGGAAEVVVRDEE